MKPTSQLVHEFLDLNWEVIIEEALVAAVGEKFHLDPDAAFEMLQRWQCD